MSQNDQKLKLYIASSATICNTWLLFTDKCTIVKIHAYIIIATFQYFW